MILSCVIERHKQIKDQTFKNRLRNLQLLENNINFNEVFKKYC